MSVRSYCVQTHSTLVGVIKLRPKLAQNFKTVRSEFNILAPPLTPVKREKFRRDPSSYLCLMRTRASSVDFRPFDAQYEPQREEGRREQEQSFGKRLLRCGFKQRSFIGLISVISDDPIVFPTYMLRHYVMLI